MLQLFLALILTGLLRRIVRRQDILLKVLLPNAKLPTAKIPIAIRPIVS